MMAPRSRPALISNLNAGSAGGSGVADASGTAESHRGAKGAARRHARRANIWRKSRALRTLGGFGSDILVSMSQDGAMAEKDAEAEGDCNVFG